MSKDSIIEKIKKLLRMKRGGTPAEIETALSLVQKIAAQNNIDINSIDENETAKEPITHISSYNLSRLQMECRYSALVINRFFNVTTFVQRGIKHKIIFVGNKTNLEIADYVYNFLIKHLRYQWNNNRGKLRNRQAFMYGIYQGLFAKLYSEEKRIEQTEGIVMIGNQVAIKNYIENNFGELTSSSAKPDKDSLTASYRGYLIGKNINIRKGLNINADAKLLS